MIKKVFCLLALFAAMDNSASANKSYGCDQSSCSNCVRSYNGYVGTYGSQGAFKKQNGCNTVCKSCTVDRSNTSQWLVNGVAP
jgi:hypothetical protein